MLNHAKEELLKSETICWLTYICKIMQKRSYRSLKPTMGWHTSLLLTGWAETRFAYVPGGECGRPARRSEVNLWRSVSKTGRQSDEIMGRSWPRAWLAVGSRVVGSRGGALWQTNGDWISPSGWWSLRSRRCARVAVAAGSGRRTELGPGRSPFLVPNVDFPSIEGLNVK
jgi:hypothetical protein